MNLIYFFYFVVAELFFYFFFEVTRSLTRFTHGIPNLSRIFNCLVRLPRNRDADKIALEIRKFRIARRLSIANLDEFNQPREAVAQRRNSVNDGIAGQAVGNLVPFDAEFVRRINEVIGDEQNEPMDVDHSDRGINIKIFFSIF